MTEDTVMRRVLPALLLLAIGLPVAAAEQTLTIDPAQTTIAFHLKATGHDVEGGFLLVDGAIRFDTETGEAGGEIRVDATRSETGNKKRDKAMHRKVLESEEYPMFVFRPERIEGKLADNGSSSLTLEGTISVHGEDHAFRMPVEAEVHEGRLSATTTFSIPFVDWGMKNPSFLILRVAKQVQVTVNAEGRLTDAGSGPGL